MVGEVRIIVNRQVPSESLSEFQPHSFATRISRKERLLTQFQLEFNFRFINKFFNLWNSQPAITCSKLTIETLE